MKNFVIVFLFLFGGGIIFSSCKSDLATPQPDLQPCGTISFTQQVQPLIMQKCNSCHSASYLCGELGDYNSVKQKVDNGTFKDKVEKKQMPPADPLSEAEIQMIQCWVNSGAPNN